MGFFGPPYKAEFPLNWSMVGGGNGTARASANIPTILNFYDPVFVGTIASNTALDPTTNTTADITFSPSVNMASLLDQTVIVASSTTINDYGYVPHIVQIDGYLPLLLNMYDSIQANTTKVIVRASYNSADGIGSMTRNLTANELLGKKCYVRRVLCFFELTTRPSGLNLDSSSWTGNNITGSADQAYFLNAGAISIHSLRGDGVTWRNGGSGTANRGNTPLFLAYQTLILNALKISTNKNVQYP